mmetsp:Transcript_32205/g.68521  ORF Transcript_32205/g.68521 Transcript_32205/m.68521 type:complete len:280 (-) Transcript_32205:77-916(-)
MNAWQRNGNFSERDLPAVFTPPRDDLALRPRLLHTPRDTVIGGETATQLATRQACAVTLVVLCAVGVIGGFVIGSYNVASSVLGSSELHECPAQPVDFGAIKAGYLNESAAVRCNFGYGVSEQPQVSLDLRCRLIYQKCVTLKAQTTMDDPVEQCDSEYAFTVEKDEEMQLLARHDKEQLLKDAWAASRRVTTGVCIRKDLLRPSRLYGQHRSLPITGGSPMVVQSERGRPSTAAASVVLTMGGVAALVCGGVARARGGGAGIRVGREPDTAPLMDVDE